MGERHRPAATSPRTPPAPPLRAGAVFYYRSSMTLAPSPLPPAPRSEPQLAPASRYALGLLGVVAALVCLLTDRILPRVALGMTRHGNGTARVAAAYLDVLCALHLLAATAWREIEAEEEGAACHGVSPELHHAAQAIHAAMHALMTALARCPAAGRGMPNVAPPRVAGRRDRSQPGEMLELVQSHAPYPWNARDGPGPPP